MTTPINRAPFNALIDDDGSNTVGTIWNKAQIQGTILDPVEAALRWTEVTTTAVGTQHNFNPGLNGDTVIRCNNASLLTISGFPAGYGGQRLRLFTIGAGQVDLLHYNAGSLTANRLVNWAASAPTSLAPSTVPTRAFAEFQYSAPDGQWVLRAHEQGACITPAYAASDYTATAGTWTVQAGDVSINAYLLRGRVLLWHVRLVGTDVSATAVLKSKIPGGFQATTNEPYSLTRTVNTAAAVGMSVASGLDFIHYQSVLGDAFTAGANREIDYKVQITVL